MEASGGQIPAKILASAVSSSRDRFEKYSLIRVSSDLFMDYDLAP
jgi:hypothetical protein